MRLDLMSWPEVEAALERTRGIVVPIGSMEQHGPNGLIGTDALCPEGIARAAHEEGDFLLGPTFSVGVAQHHLGFPGSITLRPTTMIAALRDWVASLTRHGFTRLYFLNGHGGNVATIQAAFAEIYAEWSLKGEPAPFKLTARNWWELPGVMAEIGRLFPSGHGSHATASEVALTYHLYPEAQKDVVMRPKVAPNGMFHDAGDYRAKFPDGRIGSDPSQATPEKGEAVLKVAKTGLISEVKRVFAPTTTSAEPAPAD